jgi:hypothetical protein
MRSDYFSRIGLLIVVVLLLTNLILRLETTSRAAGAVQYNVVELRDKLRFRAKQPDIQSIMDQQGSQGWELVIRYENDRGDYLIFKR